MESHINRLPVELLDQIMCSADHVLDAVNFAFAIPSGFPYFKKHEERICGQILRNTITCYEEARLLADEDLEVFSEFEEPVLLTLTRTSKSLYIPNLPRAQSPWWLYYANGKRIEMLCDVYEAYVFSAMEALTPLMRKQHPGTFTTSERLRVTKLLYRLCSITLTLAKPFSASLEFDPCSEYLADLDFRELAAINELVWWFNTNKISRARDMWRRLWGETPETVCLLSPSQVPQLKCLPVRVYSSNWETVEGDISTLISEECYECTQGYGRDDPPSFGKALTWTCMLDSQYWKEDVANFMLYGIEPKE